MPNSRDRPPLSVPLARRRRGRWLGGVCAGLAEARGVPVSWVRGAFAAAAALAGLGVLVYAACWLIIPAEGEENGGPAARGVVVLAQACAAIAGLATLGAAGAAATIFGFGWAIVATAVAVLAFALATWPRVGPGWALLPVAALALPSLAMAAADVRIPARLASVHAAPASAADLSPDGYRSGLGMLVVDLRRTRLPASGTVPLRVDAGIRRTIVALPHDRCVHVEVSWNVEPFASRLAALVTRRSTAPLSAVTLFGERHHDEQGVMTSRVEEGRTRRARRGPTLAVGFRSAGGGLVIRDYPDGVSPEREPDWPGYPVSPEPRPDTTGTPRQAARRLLRAWRERHREQVRDGRRVERLMPGPCGRSAPRGSSR